MNREFNIDELAIFITLWTMKPEEVNPFFEYLKKASWTLIAIEKHVKVKYNNRFDKSTMIMILTISDGAIGKAVRYLDDIEKRANQLNLKEITFGDFCLKIYPFGIPDL